MNYKFSHVGIPTTEDKNWDGFYEPGKIHFTDFANDEFGVEWIKCDADSPMPELFQTVAHVAYQVESIEDALAGREILVQPFSPGPGMRVAFIIHNGSPVEFMEISQ